jgi:hypothetical protein
MGTALTTSDVTGTVRLTGVTSAVRYKVEFLLAFCSGRFCFSTESPTESSSHSVVASHFIRDVAGGSTVFAVGRTMNDGFHG